MERGLYANESRKFGACADYYVEDGVFYFRAISLQDNAANGRQAGMQL